jgi:hypothetical protein
VTFIPIEVNEDYGARETRWVNPALVVAIYDHRWSETYRETIIALANGREIATCWSLDEVLALLGARCES